MRNSTTLAPFAVALAMITLLYGAFALALATVAR